MRQRQRSARKDKKTAERRGKETMMKMEIMIERKMKGKDEKGKAQQESI